MAKKVLIVVDMQNDFIDGALGTKEAQAIVPKVVDYVRKFIEENPDGTVWMTQDTHEDNYLETQEGKNLPVEHCIIGTYGWQLQKDLKEIARNNNCVKLMPKPTFGSVNLGSALEAGNDNDPISDIYVCGLCTGICVAANCQVIKAFLPEVPIHVLKDLCACVTPETHETALKAMKLCQIDII